VDPDITFSYHVAQAGAVPSGACVVDGHAAGSAVHVVCLDVTGYARHGDRVDFRGHATVDGAPTTYRVHAVDHADPGAGRDSFLIRTGTGWAGGGTLVDGDLRVR
jgi:hypothetical protein